MPEPRARPAQVHLPLIQRTIAPADVLGAEIIRTASRDGAVRFRVNDALYAGIGLNCAHAVQAGGGGVQFAVLGCAHNVERDALAPLSLPALFLLFIDFFQRFHFCVTAPPNGGRRATHAIKAARNNFAMHDRNAPVLHANRRFFGFFYCQPNEPCITSSHACIMRAVFMYSFIHSMVCV